jgi:hypothetical protein
VREALHRLQARGFGPVLVLNQADVVMGAAYRDRLASAAAGVEVHQVLGLLPVPGGMARDLVPHVQIRQRGIQKRPMVIAHGTHTYIGRPAHPVDCTTASAACASPGARAAGPG